MPYAYFEELAEAGLDVVSFHHEAVADVGTAADKARAAGLRPGDVDLHGDVGRIGLRGTRTRSTT